MVSKKVSNALKRLSKGSRRGSVKRGHPEEDEQRAVIEWCGWNRQRFPELDMIYHVPNGGKRVGVAASIFTALGVKAGVPDLCLPVGRRGWISLRIEMKAPKPHQSRISDAQRWWERSLKEHGNYHAYCYSAKEACDLIEWYLRGYNDYKLTRETYAVSISSANRQ